jgi:hypothetical protein
VEAGASPPAGGQPPEAGAPTTPIEGGIAAGDLFEVSGRAGSEAAESSGADAPAQDPASSPEAETQAGDGSGNPSAPRAESHDHLEAAFFGDAVAASPSPTVQIDDQPPVATEGESPPALAAAPAALPAFLRDAKPNFEQLRLIAQALCGPVLKRTDTAAVALTPELSALTKLTANWRSVIEGAALSQEIEERRIGQGRLGLGEGRAPKA